LGVQDKDGQTGLHWAVIGGHSDTIKLLLERGAPLEVINVYGGTVLSQALWCVNHGDPNRDDAPIIEMLLAAGAKFKPGLLAWLAQDVGRSAEVKERVAEVLRRHGAKS
jgi:ankyrin repeat protein